MMQKKLTEQGLRFLEEGQFQKASQILSLLIDRFPNNADAHHMLGIIELETGHLDAAYTLVNTAIDLEPNNSLFYNTLGNIELHRKNISQSELAFLKAVKYNMDKIEYKYNLANFYLTQNQYIKAIDYYYFILHTNPTHYLSIRGITVCYLFSGEIDIALEHANEWLNEYPEYDEPYYYQGLCLYALNNISAALTAYDKGLGISPTNHEIIAAISACYRVLGNLSISESYIHKALALEPHDPNAIYNLACIHLDKGEIDTAHDLFINALNLDDMYADPFCGLGRIELAKGNEDAALEYFKQAQKIEPSSFTPKMLSATTMIKQQNFIHGWEVYKNILTPSVAIQKIPFWSGTNLQINDTLLVWAPKIHNELSHQLMFASILPDLKNRVQNVIVLCDPQLKPLLRSSFPNYTIIAQLTVQEVEERKYPITHQIALNALGLYFRLSANAFKAHTEASYLTVDAERSDYYRNKYKQLFGDKKLIGISWKSNSNTKVTDYIKSSHLSGWQKLLKKSNYQFISLQAGEVTAEIETSNSTLRKSIYVDPEVKLNGKANLVELAAQLSALNLVISVDNHLAHLAGALGFNVYTMLPTQAEWYWFKDQDFSTWYPSMRLLRQNKTNIWAKPINELIKLL
jgi:tetratricopeptide (TPR) repeat protein